MSAEEFATYPDGRRIWLADGVKVRGSGWQQSMAKDHGSSVKGDKQYEGQRKGGRKSGKSS